MCSVLLDSSHAISHLAGFVLVITGAIFVVVLFLLVRSVMKA